MSYKINTLTLDTQGDIEKLSEKGSPVNADLLIIEDSADSFNKKKVQIGSLPGGGASLVIRTETFNYTSAMGPSYTSNTGAPSAMTGVPGSLYFDSMDGDVYLKTSAGWGTPTAAVPLGSNFPGKPYDFVGNDGDYHLDTEGAVLWGPKTAGTWTGTDNPLWTWTMVALAGDEPTALEGSEGDWGWSDDGVYIRIYGPKSASTGWPMLYTYVSNVGINTANISLVNSAPSSTTADEIRVLGGSGFIYHNNTSALVASLNGFCLVKRVVVDTGLTVPANHLFLGASVVVTSMASSTGYPLVGGYADLVQMSMRSDDATPIPGVTCRGVGTFFSNSLQEFSSTADLYLTIMDSNYGSYQSLASVTNFVGTARFFFLPE